MFMSQTPSRKSVPYQLTELQQTVLKTIMSFNIEGYDVSYESIHSRTGYSINEIKFAIETLTQMGLIQSDI